MPIFKSVLRKYTPPTCTLEIQGRESPLSRWVKLPVLNQLEFKLSFDDPRQTDEKLVTIWGDRDELEDLSQAVETYVQNFLETTPSQLPVSLLATAAALPRTTARPDNGNGSSVVNPFETGSASPTKPGDTPGDAGSNGAALRGMLSATPYLQPRGLVAHDLFLGPLATAESGPVVPLSALQLFDLATALDEYSAQMVVLPKTKGRFRRLSAPPVWTYATAAAVLALAGLTPAVMQLLKPKPSTQTAVLVPSEQAIPTEPTPIVPEISPNPRASGLPTVPNPTTSPGLSSPIPTPSGLSSPNQTPNVATLPGSDSLAPTQQAPISPGQRLPSPSLNQSPLSLGAGSPNSASTGTLSGFGSRGIPNSASTGTLPAPTRRISPPDSMFGQTSPRSFSIAPDSSPKQSATSRRRTRQTVAAAPRRATPSASVRRNTPRQTVAAATRKRPQPSASVRRNTPPQFVAAAPTLFPKFSDPQSISVSQAPLSQLPRFSNVPDRPAASNAPFAPSAPPASFPSIRNLPPIASPSTPPQQSRGIAPRDTAALPRLSPAPVTPPIPDEPVAVAIAPLTQTTPLITPSPSARPLPSNTPAGQENRERGTDDNKVATNSRLPDTIPQVAEVRDKLQQRWKPPQDLTQSLEYTLVFSGDGSIERIIPLSDAARKYMGSTGMPMLNGKPFVSPFAKRAQSAIEGGRNSKIRVVLNSNGNVETRLLR